MPVLLERFAKRIVPERVHPCIVILEIVLNADRSDVRQRLFILYDMI